MQESSPPPRAGAIPSVSRFFSATLRESSHASDSEWFLKSSSHANRVLFLNHRKHDSRVAR